MTRTELQRVALNDLVRLVKQSHCHRTVGDMPAASCRDNIPGKPNLWCRVCLATELVGAKIADADVDDVRRYAHEMDALAEERLLALTELRKAASALVDDLKRGYPWGGSSYALAYQIKEPEHES